MKKLLTLFTVILIASFANAQTLPLNFESSTTVYTFTNFDGGAATVIDNPHRTGINPSAKVGQMVKNAGKHWAGSLITLENALDFSVGTAFKMKVYSPKVGAKVLLKVENGSDPNINFEKEVVTKLANQWEELVFDYSAINTDQSYRKVVIIFELGTVGDGSSQFTYLFDDIILEEGSVHQDDAPATPAPTPPSYDASKVISIFSDAFYSLDGTNFNPFWDSYQTTVGSIEEVEGNKMVKLRTLNFHGFELANEINAAGMKYLHIDVWTANETSLDIYPVTRTSGEKKARLAPLNLNTWNSFDIRLSDLTTQGFNLADLHQFKFIGAGGNTVYIDNLYFYNDNTEPDTEAPRDFTATVSTITYNSIKLLLSATDNSGAVNYSITAGGTTTTMGAASGVQKSYEFTRLPSSTEFIFSISAKDPAGNSASNSPVQRVAATTAAFQAPVVSSPTPPAKVPEDVISVFSDSYTNVANTNFNPYWQQNTWFYSVQVGGNEVLKYENFNYQGIEIGSIVNASEMLFLHLDVWTPNETSLNIAPISQSTGEKSVRLTPLNLNNWNSYDIPLTSFTIQGLSMADIIHLKFVGSGKSIVYFDNIYFHKGTASSTDDINSMEVISFYPNPTVGMLNISSASEIRSVQVSNLAGQLMQSFAVGTFNASIDLGAVNVGYYIISVTLEDGTQSTQKILKL